MGIQRANNAWKKAIVKAMREKCFTKKGARKTATMTMRRSIAARKKPKAKESKKYTTRIEIINGVEVAVKIYPSM